MSISLTVMTGYTWSSIQSMLDSRHGMGFLSTAISGFDGGFVIIYILCYILNCPIVPAADPVVKECLQYADSDATFITCSVGDRT